MTRRREGREGRPTQKANAPPREHPRSTSFVAVFQRELKAPRLTTPHCTSPHRTWKRTVEGKHDVPKDNMPTGERGTTRRKHKQGSRCRALASSWGYEPPDLSLALCIQCGCPPPAISISSSSPCIACIPSLKPPLVGEPARLLVHAASTTTPAALLTTLPDGGNRRYLTMERRGQDGP